MDNKRLHFSILLAVLLVLAASVVLGVNLQHAQHTAQLSVLGMSIDLTKLIGDARYV